MPTVKMGLIVKYWLQYINARISYARTYIIYLYLLYVYNRCVLFVHCVLTVYIKKWWIWPLHVHILICHIILKLTRVVNIFLRDPNTAIHTCQFFFPRCLSFSRNENNMPRRIVLYTCRICWYKFVRVPTISRQLGTVITYFKESSSLETARIKKKKSSHRINYIYAHVIVSNTLQYKPRACVLILCAALQNSCFNNNRYMLAYCYAWLFFAYTFYYKL